jgi:hypothetical protein
MPQNPILRAPTTREKLFGLRQDFAEWLNPVVASVLGIDPQGQIDEEMQQGAFEARVKRDFGGDPIAAMRAGLTPPLMGGTLPVFPADKRLGFLRRLTTRTPEELAALEQRLAALKERGVSQTVRRFEKGPTIVDPNIPKATNKDLFGPVMQDIRDEVEDVSAPMRRVITSRRDETGRVRNFIGTAKPDYQQKLERDFSQKKNLATIAQERYPQKIEAPLNEPSALERIRTELPAPELSTKHSRGVSHDPTGPADSFFLGKAIDNPDDIPMDFSESKLTPTKPLPKKPLSIVLPKGETPLTPKQTAFIESLMNQGRTQEANSALAKIRGFNKGTYAKGMPDPLAAHMPPSPGIPATSPDIPAPMFPAKPMITPEARYLQKQRLRLEQPDVHPVAAHEALTTDPTSLLLKTRAEQKARAKTHQFVTDLRSQLSDELDSAKIAELLKKILGY